MAGAPFGFGPAPGGPYSGLRRSVIDPVTGQAVVTSPPTGEVVQRSSVLPIGRDDGGRLVPAVPGLAMQAVEAAKFPGQVYRGEASIFDPASGHVSDEAIGKSLDLAGTAMTGSLPFSKPAGAIGMFGGRNAKTADLSALGKAEGLAGQGADQQAIWDQTGWFQGADKKWRFEIPDDLSTIGSAGPHAPENYSRFHHDGLAEAYPHLWADTQQSIRNAPVASGRYEASDGVIHAQGPTDADQRSIALHEFQHALQAREGFSRGANPRSFTPSDWEEAGAPVASGQTYAKAHEDWAWNQYRRTAGEVEARNVQARRDMTPDQRRATPPWETQDVADADQIVRFGGAGPQMSLDGDLFASLDAALKQGIADNPQPPPRVPRRLDPDAASWDLYHGSPGSPDFQRFDPQVASNPAERGAVFFAPDPETANGYTTTGGTGDAGARVFRANVEPGRTKVFDLADLAENDPAFGARAREITTGQMGAGSGGLFDDAMANFRANRVQGREINAQLQEMGYPPGEPAAVSHNWGHIGAAVERAKAEGLDTAIIRGLAEHGGDDQAIALTPGRVRSFYDPKQVLYSGGPGGAGLGLGTAALSAPSDAQAAPAQGTSPVTASPLGLGSAAMRPEDIARLIRSVPATMGEPLDGPGFDARFNGAAPGAASGMTPQAEGRLRAGLAQSAGIPLPATEVPNTAPAATGSVGLATRQPAPSRVPSPPAPVSPVAADALAPSPAPMAPAAAAPEAAPTAPAQQGGGFLSRLSDPTVSNLLIGIGQGLMTTKGFGPALAVGTQQAAKLNQSQAATDLAQAEYGLKVRKLAQETGALKGNAAILKQANPWMTDEQATAGASNGTLVTDAMKRIQDPNFGRENDPAFIRQKAQAQAEGAAAGKPDETFTMVSEEERARLGLPAGSYQRDTKDKISPVNPTGTTINMGAEKAQDAEIGKAYGKQFVDYQTAGRNAGAKLNTLALMEQAMNTPGFYSGVGGEGVKRANQFLGALGFKDAKAASGQEVFSALGNQAVLDQLGGSLGPGVSNTDRDYITTIGPSLQKTPEGNKQLIGMYRSLAQRDQVVSKMARDYAARNGGRLDYGFDDELQSFAQANPLFPAARAAATAQSDGVTGPTAAGGIAAPRSQADFDALPKGAVYIDPSDGKKYRKN